MTDLLSAAVGFLIVFFGLGCLILLVSVMGAICKKLIREEKNAKTAAPATVPASAASALATNEIANREELVAIFSAAVAEELGVGVDAIRVVSLKQVQ